MHHHHDHHHHACKGFKSPDPLLSQYKNLEVSLMAVLGLYFLLADIS